MLGARRAPYKFPYAAALTILLLLYTASVPNVFPFVIFYFSFPPQGTIVVHSLTGGTGSGLGSRLVERIRDTYPLAHVMSVAVSPHSSGDSPLQHYNSLLSLSSLQQ